VLLFVFFCLNKMFVPGYFFRFVHDFSPVDLYLLFLTFDAAFEVNLGHVVDFLTAIVVLVFVA